MTPDIATSTNYKAFLKTTKVLNGKTARSILDLLWQHPTGLTTKSISHKLNKCRNNTNAVMGNMYRANILSKSNRQSDHTVNYTVHPNFVQLIDFFNANQEN